MPSDVRKVCDLPKLDLIGAPKVGRSPMNQKQGFRWGGAATARRAAEPS
jgi:hypothetical protein